MMSTAKINPFQLRQILAKFFLHSLQGFCQRLCSLLTKRMEVKACQSLQLLWLNFADSRSQSGQRRAWVIDSMVLSRMLWVDAQTAFLMCCQGSLPKFLPLSHRIKNKVVTVLQQLRKFLILKGRIKNMILPRKFLIGKPSLKKSAGSSPFEILGNQGIAGIHGKSLLCQQNAAACSILNSLKNFQIVNQLLFINNIGRRGNLLQQSGLLLHSCH